MKKGDNFDVLGNLTRSYFCMLRIMFAIAWKKQKKVSRIYL